MKLRISFGKPRTLAAATSKAQADAVAVERLKARRKRQLSGARALSS